MYSHRTLLYLISTFMCDRQSNETCIIFTLIMFLYASTFLQEVCRTLFLSYVPLFRSRPVIQPAHVPTVRIIRGSQFRAFIPQNTYAGSPSLARSYEWETMKINTYITTILNRYQKQKNYSYTYVYYALYCSCAFWMIFFYLVVGITREPT